MHMLAPPTRLLMIQDGGSCFAREGKLVCLSSHCVFFSTRIASSSSMQARVTGNGRIAMP